MYNYGKHTGCENDIEWCVDDSSVETVLISVKSKKTEKSETTTYKVMHPPIFGYDVDDVREIDKILDNLIKKMEKE